jgi:hypothetical protein
MLEGVKKKEVHFEPLFSYDSRKLTKPELVCARAIRKYCAC